MKDSKQHIVGQLRGQPQAIVFLDLLGNAGGQFLNAEAAKKLGLPWPRPTLPPLPAPVAPARVPGGTLYILGLPSLLEVSPKSLLKLCERLGSDTRFGLDHHFMLFEAAFTRIGLLG